MRGIGQMNWLLVIFHACQTLDKGYILPRRMNSSLWDETVVIYEDEDEDEDEDYA
jgi:hypothetical protein